MAHASKLITYRSTPSTAAIILVHGFGGDIAPTWGKFPSLLMSEPALANWDVYGLSYPTSLAFDIAGLWTADPEIVTLGGLLSTHLGVAPLDRYRALAFMAHSMGGLMVQRGLLSDETLRRRVSHLLLYGTPSGGLTKASPFAFWKRQVRDMEAGSKFITTLRQEWNQKISNPPAFTFLAIGGDRDEFVPRSSSLDPFPEVNRRVVSGNHLEMVQPEDNGHLGFKLAVKTLTGDASETPVDAALRAVESREFQRAIETLYPIRGELDSRGLVSLAMALDAVGRRVEAIDLLTEGKRKGTDVLGVLAGRLKRRWLAEQRQADAEQALALYREALSLSQAKDPAQAFYHAINCAFMEWAFNGDKEAARGLAKQALLYCEKSGVDDVWRHATEGEAFLYLGDLNEALKAYRVAMARNPEPWQIASMYQQAVRVADLTRGEEGGGPLTDLFRGAM